MNTIAAVLSGINKPLQIEELIMPELKKGQLLVRVAYSGVCHSQLNEIRGLKGPDKFIPHTLGHEGSGIVEAIGPEVKKAKPGDHIVLTWIKGTGADEPSTVYERFDATKVNSGAIATFMTKTVVSENRVVKISENMPLREAALLGCAIPTGAGIIFNTAKTLHGSTIAVFGIGGIGLSALLAAKAAGAAVIIAVDVFDHKLDLAFQLGATHMVNAKKQDVLSYISDVTHRRGVDCSVESAGSRESMENAFKAVRDNGGLCVLSGNLPAGHHISIDPMDLIKGKCIEGTWGGETKPDRDIPMYADLFLSGKLPLDKILTHQFKLQDINEAFNLLEKGEVGRAVIEL